MIKKIVFKKSIFPITLILLLIFSLMLISIPFVNTQSDLTMFLGNSINDSDIDGIIGDEWDDVISHNNIEISPQGNAQIWIKHDQTHLYVAVVFEADSNNPWAAIQLGNPDCMTSNTDGAIFGHDDLSPNGYRDINFGGFGIIRSDTSQDGVGAMDISMNTLTIELKKPLNTQDTDGKDIQWSQDNSYDIIIMWDSNGGGSSGGTTNHTSRSPKPKTIYLEAQTTPSPSPTPTQSPSPTPTPTQTPSPTTIEPLTIIAIIAVVVIISAILIYFLKYRK
jgi:hypothetical protein